MQLQVEYINNTITWIHKDNTQFASVNTPNYSSNFTYILLGTTLEGEVVTGTHVLVDNMLVHSVDISEVAEGSYLLLIMTDDTTPKGFYIPLIIYSDYAKVYNPGSYIQLPVILHTTTQQGNETIRQTYEASFIESVNIYSVDIIDDTGALYVYSNPNVVRYPRVFVDTEVYEPGVVFAIIEIPETNFFTYKSHSNAEGELPYPGYIFPVEVDWLDRYVKTPYSFIFPYIDITILLEGGGDIEDIEIIELNNNFVEVASSVTDSFGVARLERNRAGKYLMLKKTGKYFKTNLFEITAAPAQSITTDYFTYVPKVDPDICTVFGKIVNLDGTLVADVNVQFTLDGQLVTSNNTMIVNTHNKCVTDVDGVFTAKLYKGVKYKIAIQYANFFSYITTPEVCTNPIQFTDIISSDMDYFTIKNPHIATGIRTDI